MIIKHLLRMFWIKQLFRKKICIYGFLFNIIVIIFNRCRSLSPNY